jgi:integrase/recombinase XerC
MSAAIADDNAALVAAFGEHLLVRAALTRAAYVRDVERLAGLAGKSPLQALGRAEISRMLAQLHAQGLSGRSLARMLSAWRAFYRFVREREPAQKDDPCAGLRAPKSPRRLPSALSPDEAARLVTIESDDPMALRDRALFELAYSSGLRLSELASLDVERLDRAGGEVRVMGKGSKERIVPVGAAARAAIDAWLATREKLGGGSAPALFVSRGGRRLSPRAIQKRLAQWAIKQGLSRHVHPHMLRHSFASHVLQSSGDLRAVQEMLGHASIASTQVYTHLDFQALAKVYDQAHPRARKRKA